MSSLFDAYALTIQHRSRRVPANDNHAMIAFANEGLDLSLSSIAYKVIDGLDGLFTKGLATLRAARVRRRSILELERLSDRNLADIGIHRSEIVSVVDDVIAGGTPHRSERVIRGAPKVATSTPVSANDDTTSKLAA